MGLKVFMTQLADLNHDEYIRCDTDFHEFQQQFKYKSTRFLKDYTSEINTGKPIERSDYVSESVYIHLVVRNIASGVLNLDSPIYISEAKGESLSSHRVCDGDIVVAISAKCGSALYVQGLSGENQFTLSHYLAKFRVDETKILPELLSFYFNSSIIQKYFRATETGKTQKNLSKTYLRNLPIFLPESLVEQTELLQRIRSLVDQITQLEQRIKKTADVINLILGDELGFNWNEYEQLKAIKVFNRTIADAAFNVDCRIGCRFHNPASQYILDFLRSKTNSQIKNHLSEPIVLGKGISPKQYDDRGDYFYISMACIKSWRFDPSGAKLVSNAYSSANQNKTVRSGDILLARSGEGTIGKVALIESDIQGVFADFTQRIRLVNYDQHFAYYFFRSEFFQSLVYADKKGLGNNTNIFPSQVREFPMLDWGRDKQREIANTIKAELDLQDDILCQIIGKRVQATIIMDDAIMEVCDQKTG